MEGESPFGGAVRALYCRWRVPGNGDQSVVVCGAVGNAFGNVSGCECLWGLAMAKVAFCWEH